MLPDNVKVKERDKETIAVRADPLLRTAASIIKRNVLAAYDKNESVIPSIVAGFKTIKTLFADAMTLAHIKAGVRVFESIPHKAKKLSAYDNALDVWKSRMQLSDVAVEQLRQKYGELNVTVLKGAQDAVEKKAQEAIQEIIGQGMHVKEASEYLGNALNAAGLDPQSPFLLETLVRTQVSIAYAAGQWKSVNDPMIAGYIWGYEIITVGDDRVRPEHAACNHLRLPKEDPQWETLWPPLFGDYNCRCVVQEIWFDDPAEERTINRVGGDVIDRGHKFNPGVLFS